MTNGGQVGPARAGVYFPADPTPWPLPANPKHFELLLGERQNVASLEATFRAVAFFGSSLWAAADFRAREFLAADFFLVAVSSVTAVPSLTVAPPGNGQGYRREADLAASYPDREPSPERRRANRTAHSPEAPWNG